MIFTTRNFAIYIACGGVLYDNSVSCVYVNGVYQQADGVDEHILSFSHPRSHTNTRRNSHIMHGLLMVFPQANKLKIQRIETKTNNIKPMNLEYVCVCVIERKQDREGKHKNKKEHI